MTRSPRFTRCQIAVAALALSGAAQAASYTPQAVAAFAALNPAPGETLQLNFANTLDANARNSDIDVQMQIVAADGSVLVEDRGRVAPGQTRPLKFDPAASQRAGAQPLHAVIRSSVAGQVCDNADATAARGCEQIAKSLLAQGRVSFEAMTIPPDPYLPPDPYAVQIVDHADNFFIVNPVAQAINFGLLLPAVRTGNLEATAGDAVQVQVVNQAVGTTPADIVLHNPPGDHNPPGYHNPPGFAYARVAYFGPDGALLAEQFLGVNPGAVGIASFVVPRGLAPCVRVAISLLPTATGDGNSKVPYTRLQATARVLDGRTQAVRLSVGAIANSVY